MEHNSAINNVCVRVVAQLPPRLNSMKLEKVSSLTPFGVTPFKEKFQKTFNLAFA